jgi:hypothetical protein
MCSFEAAILAVDQSIYNIEQSVTVFVFVLFFGFSGHCGCDHMAVGQLFMQSVPITTNVVSINPTQAIQHYVIKFVSDLRQVGGFLRILVFPPPIKPTATI